MTDRSDLKAILAAYVDGTIEGEQVKELEAALRMDAGLRREFIESMNLDSALSDLAALSDAEFAEAEPDLTKTVTPDPRPRRRRRLRVATALIAVVASVLVLIIIWNAGLEDRDRPVTSADPPVARVVRKIDAVLKKGTVTWENDVLPTGEFRLERGLLHLEFAGGVMAFVEAPARLHFVGERRIVLLSGRLSAEVPPAGVGFIVETPEAEVVDFGTEFSVEASSGASEVHVFDGRVRVRPRSSGEGTRSVDLRTSQAVRIEDPAGEPVGIDLARDRFIRNFDEPKRRYPRSVKRLSPLAYYRMPIRDRGLASDPPQHAGVVLTGEGVRPPHACGVLAGGSLRIGADSTGRGGRVDVPPRLGTGRFTLAVFVYLEAPAPGGTVATNLDGDKGNFELALDEDGRLRATIRDRNGALQSVVGEVFLPLKTWRYVVVTADGQRMRLYEDGREVASIPCTTTTTSDAETVWFGTDAEASGMWDGRIDELALFDRALSDKEIADLYRSALGEMTRSE